MHNKAVEENVASIIRELYLMRRRLHVKVLRDTGSLYESDTLHPKWDGGRDSRGVEHKRIWPELARISIENSIDPAAWVDTLFAHASDFDHIPWPSDLKSKKILKDAGNWAVKQAEEVANRLKTEMVNLEKECWLRSMASDLPSDELARSVVCDPRTDASPLVRYVFASSRGHMDVAAGFESAALAQYATAPKAYREAFGNRLPARFLAKAKEG